MSMPHPDHDFSQLKPLLRGWLHTVTAPLALVAGAVLIALAPHRQARWSVAVYTATAVLLFGTSALYHRGNWSPRVERLLKRIDHSNIFLIIAGSYTPFAVLLLDGQTRDLVLWVVWGGAIAGVLFRVAWVGAPRWLYTPLYIALGWVAVFFLPAFARTGGVAVLVLIAIGGLFYSAGGVIYALKRPNPSPRYFGFHEIFHLLTVLAFICQYVAISIATYR
ncbi:MAG: hemolysin [Frankiaceae bacterium]|jgi:hemolysin III|nr:hemolysin [Frankiaceae bacterium]MDX6273096.1 hemolysin [Frankiales bacterium]